ncbi:MAG: YybS family protein [Deltaproteobacteria bacterium]|nr:YybS family protein [Deltaproteobacteria bacterium]
MKKFGISASDNPFSKFLPFVFLFVFAAVFVPFIGPFFLFLLPMILFLNGTVNGTVKTAAFFLVSFAILLILAVLLKLNVPAVAVFVMGVAGLLMTMIAAKNYSIEKTIIYPALLLMGAVCFYFIYDAVLQGGNPWLLVKNFITATIQENVKLYSQLPVKAEDINVIKDNEKNIIDVFIQIFPSMVVILSVLIIWLNLLLGRNYLSRAGTIYPRFIALARWKAPDFIIWIFIISGGLLFVPQKDINFLSLNVFLVACFIYFLQGLAVVSFLFQSKKVPIFFRYLFYFLIAVQQILMIPIATIGLFDIWADFRKLFQKNQTAA